MALSSSNAVRQLSDGNTQGTTLGQSSSDKIAFYGSTPVVQGTVIADHTNQTTNTAVPGNSSTAWAFYNSSQANAVLEVVTRLKTMGLIG